MIKAFKYRLYPNKATEKKLHWTLTRCRELYNAALSERKDAYKYAGKSISRYDQQNDLPEIKEIREEYKEISAHVLQDVVHRLDKAFQAFFRRLKIGENPGYPRFQGKNRYNSFTNPDGLGHGVRIDEKHLAFPKIGKIRVNFHRPLEGKVKTTTIKREGDEWYVVFSCEVERPSPLPMSSEEVGIDLGLTHFAALSNGEFIDNPRYYRKSEKKLERLQQELSRKKKGSHRRDKAKKQLSRAYRKVRNQRRDFLHKGSRKLINQYQVIMFEDLPMERLVARPAPKQDEVTGQYLPNGASQKSGLNKSINDAGWSQFTQYCVYKAECAGRQVEFVDPHKTSQVCSECLKEGPHKDLADRTHICIHCGLVLDRDTNAAINILRLGRSQRSNASKLPAFRQGSTSHGAALRDGGGQSA